MSKLAVLKYSLGCLATLLLAGTGARAAESYDVLIKNGTVYDGTGSPGVAADVGIRAGKIVLVGDAGSVSADQVIDAKGLAVAPGFIDAHAHVADYFLHLQSAQPGHPDLTAPILNEGFLTQGVTTTLCGPDGGLSPSEIKATMALFKRNGITTNYAFYVGHNGVRLEVMDHEQRAPTAAELGKMQALVREGMQMGAVGLSTGLMYDPGMFSETAEIIALAQQVKPFDGTYDSHTRNPVFDIIGSDQEVIDVGRAAGIPAKIGHIKPVGLLNKGRSADEIALVEKARAAGLDVVADQYPYDGAAVTALRNVLIVSPERQGRRSPALPDVQKILADKARLADIKAMTEHGVNGGFSWIKAAGYGTMRIVHAPGTPKLVGENLELLARKRSIEPFDLLVDLLLSSKQDIFITLGAIDEADLRVELSQPWNMIASDGDYYSENGARIEHPRSTGTFTRVLGHYSRDVQLFPLGEAIRKMSSLPADHLRLYDRGHIANGYAADITIFDPATVRDRSTYAEPAKLSEGIIHVLVNGEFALRDGKLTGKTPGRFVARQSKQAQAE